MMRNEKHHERMKRYLEEGVMKFSNSDVKDLIETIEQQQKEIERLNKISEEYKEKYQDVYEGFCSYEQALKEISETSGKSMIHSFTIDGHKESVFIAEKALEGK